MNGHAPSLMSYVVIGAVMAAVVWFRARRLTRKLDLDLKRMWIIPALVLAYAAATLWQFPPKAADWAWLLLAAACGGALGWLRGKLMAITYDPETGALSAQGSPVAIYLVGALVAVRFGLRAMLASEGHAPAIALSQANDLLICFTVGLLTLQRVEMGLRATRLKAAAVPLPPP